jgi:hypothetical protein
MEIFLIIYFIVAMTLPLVAVGVLLMIVTSIAGAIFRKK